MLDLSQAVNLSGPTTGSRCAALPLLETPHSKSCHPQHGCREPNKALLQLARLVHRHVSKSLKLSGLIRSAQTSKQKCQPSTLSVQPLKLTFVSNSVSQSASQSFSDGVPPDMCTRKYMIASWCSNICVSVQILSRGQL